MELNYKLQTQLYFLHKYLDAMFICHTSMKRQAWSCVGPVGWSLFLLIGLRCMHSVTIEYKFVPKTVEKYIKHTIQGPQFIFVMSPKAFKDVCFITPMGYLSDVLQLEDGGPGLCPDPFFALVVMVVVQFVPLVPHVRVEVQDALLDLLAAQVRDLQDVQEEGDGCDALHEHHEDAFLRRPGNVAVHRVGTRVPLALEERLEAEAVQEVLARHEGHFYGGAREDVDHVGAQQGPPQGGFGQRPLVQLLHLLASASSTPTSSFRSRAFFFCRVFSSARSLKRAWPM